MWSFRTPKKGTPWGCVQMCAPNDGQRSATGVIEAMKRGRMDRAENRPKLDQKRPKLQQKRPKLQQKRPKLDQKRPKLGHY